MAGLNNQRFQPMVPQPGLPEGMPPELAKYLKAQQQMIANLAQTIARSMNPMISAGNLADRPAVNTMGFFYANDVSHLYFNNGSNWIQIV